jgi:spore germination protein GerM
VAKRRIKLKKPPRWLWLAGLVLLGGIGAFFWLSGERGPSVKVFFFQGEKLVPVSRPLLNEQAPLKTALQELLKGPNAQEQLRGFSTQIPKEVALLDCRLSGGVAILNFNRQLENYGGGSARLKGLLRQIVFTATALPNVGQAWLWVEGEQEVVLGGEGFILDRPLSRRELFN